MRGGGKASENALDWRSMLPPDLILHNGKIITLDATSRLAQAIAVRAGLIASVGEDAPLLKTAAPTTRCIDLKGYSVLPGFFDAHPHADREGLKARGGIPIAGLHSVAAIVDVVKRAAQTIPAGEWIVLMPMGEPPHEYISRPEQLTDGRFPTRHDLDAVAPDHAVYIRAVWGWWSHRPFPSVANSLALRRAGVTRDTPAPHNVDIVKDARGEPTGVFLERNFGPVLEYTLFRDLPRFKYADRLDSVRLGAQAYAAAGTTSLYEGHGLTPTVIRAYRENAERGALPLRMHAPISMPSAAFDDKRLLDLFYHYAGVAGGRGRGDDILRVEGINLGGHADSTVAEIIAAGYPYDQWAGHFYQAMTPARFVKLGIEAARLGLRVNCVVSRDLEYALSAYEAIDKEVPIRDRRWVVIHVNQASDAQIRRMKALGVIATVVPGFLWMAGDRYGLDRLGEEGIPIRRMLDGGVPVALSTDGVPYSMLWTAWEAIARWDDDGQRRLGESRLTREEALRMAIQSGHRLTWNEDRFGSLEVGKVADLVVLAEDPLSCELDRLKDIRVDRTFLGGREVFVRR
ncbi:MAG: amidohydrolase [Alphaproteobacteria bacterium]|nr:MAG: amidohydrolase [Alphaproteobacteria bacterium]